MCFGRQLAVERQDIDAAGFAQVADCPDGPHDFVATGHEDEDIALGLLVQDTPHLLGGEIPDRAGRRTGHRHILDVDRISPAIRRQSLRITHPAGDTFGVERGGHGDQHQVGPPGLLELSRQRQRHVGMQVALVELVENDRPDALELRVGSHLPKQQGFGDELDARLGGLDALEPDLVTDFAAQLDAALLGNTRCQETGGDAAGLEDDDLPLHQAEVQEHLGNPGRLTRTGRRTENDPPGTATGGDERFLQRIDG